MVWSDETQAAGKSARPRTNSFRPWRGADGLLLMPVPVWVFFLVNTISRGRKVRRANYPPR